MMDLCSACLCADRKLFNLQETAHANVYSQILSEISVSMESDLPIQVCWECVAMVKKLDRFKQRVKSSYFLLQECAELDLSKLDLSHPSCLQIHHLSSIDILETDPGWKTEPDHLAASLPQKVKIEYSPHLEPETFVNELKVSDDEEREEGHHHDQLKMEDELKEQQDRQNGEHNSGVENIIKKKEKKPKITKKIKTKVRLKSKKSKMAAPPSLHSDCDNDINGTDCASETDNMPLAESEGDRPIDIQPRVEQNIHENIEQTIVRAPSQESPMKRSREKLPDKPTCPECGKVFSSRKTYRYHLNVLHKGNNKYPCARCGKVFQWKSNLGRHMRTHKAVDSDELFCALCDKRFASIATYRQHLSISRRHVPETDFPFSCNECGKKFVSKTRLRDHIDWEHLNNIKFRCAQCDKAFKCHTSLYVHRQNVHRDKDKKNNLCHVCGKSYQNPAKLKYHIVAMHTSQTPYQCSECSAAFGWYSSLYRHVREVHYKMKVQQKKSKRNKKLDVPATVPPLPPLEVTMAYLHSAPHH